MTDDTKQYQGEPVAWLIKWASDGSFYMFTQDRERSEKLRNDPEFVAAPLYTHADPGEVERLREQLAEAQGRIRTLEAVNEVGVWADTATEKENAALRAQLAERDALLNEIADEWGTGSPGSPQLWFRIDAALSASAEPRAEK